MKKFYCFCKSIYEKYREFITYVFWGVCATVVNYFCYILFYYVFGVPNVPSDIIAWVVSVTFAFFSNKFFVFRKGNSKHMFREAVEFFACRGGTGALDVLLMMIGVDFMHWNAALIKFLVGFIVAALNYVASKFLVFRK